MKLKIRHYFLILLALCVLLGGFYVTQKYTRVLDTLFGSAGIDAAGGRVDSDIESVSDGLDDSRESLGRLGEGLGEIRDSAEEIERGVDRLESGGAELEARSREIEEGLGGIRDAESRARAAIELGHAANQRLEDLIRRLQAESGAGDPAQEGVADPVAD